MRKISAFRIVVIIFAVSITLLTMYHQSLAQKAPRVILLGESRDFSPEIMSKMPTGYSQDIRGLDSIDFDITTGDPDDPAALFSINPEIPNIDNQMEFAKSLGKEEIYFFVMKPI